MSFLCRSVSCMIIHKWRSLTWHVQWKMPRLTTADLAGHMSFFVPNIVSAHRHRGAAFKVQPEEKWWYSMRNVFVLLRLQFRSSKYVKDKHLLTDWIHGTGSALTVHTMFHKDFTDCKCCLAETSGKPSLQVFQVWTSSNKDSVQPVFKFLPIPTYQIHI